MNQTCITANGDSGVLSTLEQQGQNEFKKGLLWFSRHSRCNVSYSSSIIVAFNEKQFLQSLKRKCGF
jgi:hypothetical protein